MDYDLPPWTLSQNDETNDQKCDYHCWVSFKIPT